MTGIRATLRLRFATADDAQRVAAALAADDDEVATTRREGTTVFVEVKAERLRSVLRALDDVLANSALSEDLLTSPSLDDELA